MTDRGAMSVLGAALAGIIVLAGLVGMDLYRLMAVKTAAEAAADAAALAAAPVTFAPFGAEAGPQAEAAIFAEANGARLVACTCPLDPVWRPRTVTVTVAVGVTDSLLGVSEVQAVSSAEFDPTVWLQPSKP